MWIPGPFIALLRDRINLGATMSFSTSDILDFLRIQLLLGIYKCSSSAFYSEENETIYQGSKAPLSKVQHDDILKQLGAKDSTQGVNSTDQWDAPFSNSGLMNQAMQQVRNRCSEFGYVPGKSIVSLDDDQLRLRSHNVDDNGYVRTRNPKKGFGPTQHGAISTVTSLYLGGHIPSRGETQTDSVNLIFRSFCGVNSDRHINLKSNIIALDRGYQSTSLNQAIADRCGRVVGTHKRTKGFPFTYDHNENENCIKIDTDGALSTYWAKGEDNHCDTIVSRFALAYRSGL
jgi:hypothetical protein